MHQQDAQKTERWAQKDSSRTYHHIHQNNSIMHNIYINFCSTEITNKIQILFEQNIASNVTRNRNPKYDFEPP